ncbi:MAG: sodium:proton antiporter [Proteobacteria bacterium]|nr:sodium:proton antiporter [Pseudomonadota bacterium]
MKRIVWLAGLFTAAFCTTASAAEAHLDGAQLSLLWPLPFVGILLSIALFPLLAPKFWEHHFGKVAAFWALAFLLPCAAIYGVTATWTELLHTAVLEYLPFIILLLSLFVVSGGIRIAGNLAGNPATNTAMLAIGTFAASVVGTTGASMLLIRPLIVANKQRPNNVHVFIFFIFLVSNIGGSLTPLGDPPLFLGFLKGVDFLWTVESMFAPMALASVILLALFFVIDNHYWRKEGHRRPAGHTLRHVEIDGLHNVIYLAGIVGAVLVSGIWKPGVSLPVGFGIAMPLEGVVRDIVLLVLAWLSWRTTRRNIRIENAFTWTPIQEVALLFAGIFITIIPALAILRAGKDGHLAPLLAFVTGADGQPINAAYFWLTGALSSFLDNAPTYLVFFNLAGGDPHTLMGPLYKTLLAISAGAVFMGANSYIGNAPNFMVKSICEERGIRMPSFFGYMAWSGAILLPLFVVITLVFFR